MHKAQIEEQIHILNTKQDLYEKLEELQREEIYELKVIGKAFERC